MGMTEADEILDAVDILHEIRRLALAYGDDPRVWIDSIIVAATDPENPLYVLFPWDKPGSQKYRRRRVRETLTRLFEARLAEARLAKAR